MRLAVTALLVCFLATSRANADWFDDFDGNQFHNPFLGSWDFTGYNIDSEVISGWRPTLLQERAVIASPYSSPGAPVITLGAGWVESSANDAHRYRNSRISGTVGAGNNGGLGNNNLMGVLARLDDFDTYVLAVDHNTGTINLLKSRTVDPGNPIPLASEPIVGYSLQNPYYLVLDVLDISGGTRLQGRIYENSTRTTLLNTVIGFDDDGEGVPGPTLRPDHSGFFAQVNPAAANPLPVDAYFDDMWAQVLRPGDVNLDAEVDRADLARLARSFGRQTDATWDDGDVDGNGQVDLRDLILLKQHLPTPPAPAASASQAVPEPSALLIVLTGFAATRVRSRRGRATPCGFDREWRD